MLHYLFVCCLIVNRIEINVAENNNSITEKSPWNNIERLLNIQSELLEIQDDIIFITKAIGQADNLNSITSKTTVTEETFKLIENELANALHQPVECSESVMTMIVNHYDAVCAQLKNLQLSVMEFKHKRYSADIVKDIKELKFSSAQEKLQQLNNISDVLEIFKDVYKSSSDNFDLLANLTESLTDFDLIYNSVKALQNVLSAYGNGDPYKWIRLVNALETGVIYQLDVSLKTKASARDVVNELYKSIRVFTMNALKVHTSMGTFEKNGEMDNLTTAVYLFDPSLSESIIEDYVDTSFKHQEYLKDIFDTILSHKFIQQRIKGLIVLFWKLKDSSRIDNDVTIDIASALYKIHSDKQLKTLRRSMRIGVKRIIETLPACARNLYFLPTVCLWNRAKEEYLTASNSTFNNDKNKRNIFLSEDPLPGSHWYVERVGDKFLFFSQIYTNEYLYAADFNFNREFRYLFSWMPGKNTDKQSKWNIRLNGDFCYIQSSKYYENMVSSNLKRLKDDMQFSNVFTYTPRTEMNEYEFQWQIGKCD